VLSRLRPCGNSVLIAKPGRPLDLIPNALIDTSQSPRHDAPPAIPPISPLGGREDERWRKTPRRSLRGPFRLVRPVAHLRSRFGQHGVVSGGRSYCPTSRASTRARAELDAPRRVLTNAGRCSSLNKLIITQAAERKHEQQALGEFRHERRWVKRVLAAVRPNPYSLTATAPAIPKPRQQRPRKQGVLTTKGRRGRSSFESWGVYSEPWRRVVSTTAPEATTLQVIGQARGIEAVQKAQQRQPTILRDIDLPT